MSSEIITKNDLKAILDTALPTQPVLIDSGWKTATLSSAFANYIESEPLQFRRVGKIVEVRGAVKPTAEIAGSDTWYTIFTLPLGYRPSRPKTVTQQGSGTSLWLSSVDANGNVSFSRYRNGTSYVAASTTVWLNLYLNFLIDDDDWPVTPVTTADYIVEQGTSGIWSYRKWNSGIAECWCKQTVSVNFSQQISSNFRMTTSATSIAYPDIFTSITDVLCSASHSTNSTWLTMTSGQVNTTAKTVECGFMGWNTGGTQSVIFSIHITGTWK